MENIRIFCEGVSDQRFLRDFIFLNYGIEISDNQLKKNEIIHNLGGFANLKNLKNKITEELFEFTSLIFLDADDEKTVEKAGKEKSEKFIDDLMLEWNWKNYDKYIFPNNVEVNGEVEDFFEKIINEENSDIFDCWNNFEKCLLDKNKGYMIPAKKSKIYLYHEVLLKEKYKDPERDFKDGNLWNLEKDENSNYKNSYLQNLKQFLDKYLIIN